MGGRNKQQVDDGFAVAGAEGEKPLAPAGGAGGAAEPAGAGGAAAPGAVPRLVETPAGLALVADGMELVADFTRLIPRLREDRLRGELLVRAARVRGVERPRAVDMTAGLGEDSLLLAAAGFEVVMFEADPAICALLADALRRAAAVPALADVVARMRLIEGNSKDGVRELGFYPDVVYLDPMFPARTKSAAVKKKFQLLHHLETPCTDELPLLEAARAALPRKIVVKRPPKGPYLAGVKPSHSLQGKAVRFDVIACPPRP